MNTIDPVKLCCGKKQSEHNGPQCPDGKVMCCLCYQIVIVEDLEVDKNGQMWDNCKKCKDI